ncbi:MAG TPA: hypothetical protein VFQ40_00655, partial [Actinomycetota bacterium]|nr:hypothetical protein [Actinomycetota bacterium]
VEEADYEPATVEPIEGQEIARVTLTEDAVRRIELDTSAVSGSGDDLAVPESAIWVDANGHEWVYTSPEPLVFVRAEVTVTRYDDGTAHLSKGPAPGTDVVSVGVAELIGSEFGI